MAVTYVQKKYKQRNIIYTAITIFALCAVFLAMIAYLYHDAELAAEENLHEQTKQIKDDLRLQIISDQENLATMASFAAKLYRDGESYDLMFESFKPIGLLANIGILNPDGTFSTKAGSIDLSGRISFEEERAKGAYISSRVVDLTQENYELVRTAVPITVDGETVGILYGVIKLDAMATRYGAMAEELEAQLFVYGADGELVLDTVHEELGNISFLRDRRYYGDSSYELMEQTPNGFLSFKSAYRNENAYLHYSTIDELGWRIAMVRYDSMVFAETHDLARHLFFVFFVMVAIMIVYVVVMLEKEKGVNRVAETASDIRQTLLETSGYKNHIEEALCQIREFARARSAIFFNTDGALYHSVASSEEGNALYGEDRIYFNTELLKYADAMYRLNLEVVNVLCIAPNKHLQKTNPAFYGFLVEHKIAEVSYAAITNSLNHTTIVAVLNPENRNGARMLSEKVAVCFSIALNNKMHLDKTTLAATTDSLTGALNRMAYNNDIEVFDREQPTDFSCVYIDVNELHMINNKYGHAAGDEMLLYIANALKEIFYGHRVYRIGGDEFLVFVSNTAQENVKEAVNRFVDKLATTQYRTAIGLSYRAQNIGTDEIVKEAEMRMYEAKSQYYQNKETHSIAEFDDKEYVQTETGIREIDMMLSVLKEHYHGIYRVSLNTDKASRILMPAYLGYNEEEEHFSELMLKYVMETVESDHHRAVTSFMNYESIRHQLAEGDVPKIVYKKKSGETVTLTVYKIDSADGAVDETLWVFEKR